MIESYFAIATFHILEVRMEKYYAKKDATKSGGSAETIESRVEQKRPRIELDMRDIVADPG